jgi:hypothetical protein
VTVYSEQDDKEAMFRRPRFVLRGGALIVEDSEIRARSSSATLVASHRDHDDGADRLESWHEDHASFDASRLGPVAELRRAFREIGGTRR